MKKVVKLFSILLVICFGFSCVSAQAFATDVQTKPISSVEYPENFIPITREEYLRSKSEKEGITYDEAAAIVDRKIETAKAALPTPKIWDGDYTETNPDGTFTLYGRVYKIYAHRSGLQAIYEVQAVMVASHYGRSWADCNSTGSAYPYGPGFFVFEGDCTASLVSTTTLRMTLSGYFDVEEDIAIDNSVNLEFFGYSYSVGHTMHYRDNIYDTHLETIVN